MSLDAIRSRGNESDGDSSHLIDVFLHGNSSIGVSLAGGIVSDKVAFMFSVVNIVVICLIISLFGIVTNIMNVIVFLRMGFKESINISFFMMAISDIFLHAMSLYLCAAMNPWFLRAVVGGEAIFLVGSWVRVIAQRITGWITAFVAFERCLCIFAPLKVKAILSPSRTKIINAAIFIGTTTCALPLYFAISVKQVYHPQYNKTVILFRILDGKRGLLDFMFILNSVIFNLASFAAILICLILLVVNLKRTNKWRSQFSASTEEAGSKVKEQRVGKMVLSIAIIYIVCYAPATATFALNSENHDFTLIGRLRNLYRYVVLISFVMILEGINSSLNIFIYYYMSSKYKMTFSTIMCLSKDLT